MPGNRLLARPAHLVGHTPLLTQCPACGRGQRAVGGRAEEVGFGKPSLNQWGTKASAGRLPSTVGQRARREDESPGIVRQLCPGPRGKGNSAALSGSGLAAHYHTAGLVNWAGLGARSSGQGCGHSPAVLRAGPSSWAPRTPNCVTSQLSWSPSLSQSSLRVLRGCRPSAGLRQETTHAPVQGSVSPAPGQPGTPAGCSDKETRARRQASLKATARLHLCRHRATPARIAPRKRGADREGPGAAGARLGWSAHGEECSLLWLARPARAAQSTQAGLSAKLGAQWRVL